jgi:hypothetical protein
MITEPRFVAKSAMTGIPLKHKWNDSDPELAYPENRNLERQLQPISYRGVLAFSLGCAEWIAWRMRPFFQDQMLLLYIEGLWAGMVDWNYLHPLRVTGKEFDWRDWEGPERGPVLGAMLRLEKIAELTQRKYFSSPEASSLAQLALLVVPVQKPVKDWSREVISRLKVKYPYSKTDELGPPVPRQLLDIDTDWSNEDTNILISKFLAGLDFEKNPFLRSPDEMTREGFQGIPYKQ